MQRPKFTRVLKPTALHEAETRGVADDLSEVTSRIELATLAVMGLGADLADESGGADKIASLLRGAATDLEKINKRLSPLDLDATKRKLDEVMGGCS